MRQRTIKAAVKIEMRKIARQKIKEEIKRQGLTISMVTRDEIKRLVKKFLASDEAKVIEYQVRQRIEILSTEV